MPRSEKRRFAALPGVTTMEMSILCVMIAVAVIMAVIVFGHTVWRGFDTMKGATAGYGGESGTAAKEYAEQSTSDAEAAAKFPENFSDVH